MKTLMLTLMLAAAAAWSGRADAATQDTPAKILEKAILIEETEQDLPVAVQLYRSVIDDASASASERTVAWLRLGGCLRKLGREDEAVAALERAAEGEGEAAVRARKLLAGTAGNEDRLRARVEELLRSIAVGDAPRQLVMLGEPAVPLLVEAIEDEKVAITEVERVLEVMVEVGGPVASDFFRRIARSDDTLMKRVLVVAYQQPGAIGAGVDEAFFELLRDETPAVRREALGAAYRRIPEALLAKMTEDPDASVRARAFDIAITRDFTTHTEFMEAIEPAVVRAWSDESLDARTAALRFPTDENILRTPAGRRIFLEALPLEAIPAAPIGNDTLWPKSVLWDTSIPFDAPPTPDGVLAAARKLGRPLPRAMNPRQYALYRFILNCLPAWDREAMPQVLDIAGLGYDQNQMSRWVLEYARPSDALTIANRIGDLAETADIATWLAEQPLPAEAFEPLRDWVEADVSAASVPGAKWNNKGFDSVIHVLVQSPSDRAIPYLVDLVRRYGTVRFVASTVIEQLFERGDEEAAQGLATIVRMESTSPATRLWILSELSEKGDARVVALAPEAYRLGAQKSDGGGLLAYLTDRNSKATLDEASVVAIFDGCLALESEEIWKEIQNLLNFPRPNPLPSGVLTVACRHAVGLEGRFAESAKIAMGLLHKASGSIPEAIALAESLLRSEDPATLSGAARWLVENATGESRDAGIAAARRLLGHPEPYWRRTAAVILADCGAPEAAEWIRPLLSDEDSQVRVCVAQRFLYGNFPDEPVETFCALLHDRNSSVRALAAKILGKKLDRAASPALIEALRDESENVREAAGEALDAIQTYYDRIERWKRWMRESELGADTAAEALLAQAQEGNPRDVRLAAIRSLGTLGVPETLPILIRLMSDPDPDIAAAAQSAVDRINGDR